MVSVLAIAHCVTSDRTMNLARPLRIKRSRGGQAFLFDFEERDCRAVEAAEVRNQPSHGFQILFLLSDLRINWQLLPRSPS